MTFIIPEGTSKATYVRNKFTGIAARYDLFNDIVTQGMHRYWKRFLVNKALLKAGDLALDICCGTGDITQLIQKRVGPEGLAIGLDFSSGMLSVAAARNKTGTTALIRGDATVLPFKDGYLDAVTVGYGLRNLVDIDCCVQEVWRVLKPGGRFLSLDMGKVAYPVIRQLFAFYFFKIVPRIGKLIYPQEDLFDYFPASSLNFPSQTGLAQLIADHGFEEVRFFNFYFGSVAVHVACKKR